jgi:Ca2+-binding RTX toxin-like protein
MRRSRIAVALLVVGWFVVSVGPMPPAAAAVNYEATVTTVPALPATIVYGQPATVISATVDFGTDFEEIVRLCFTTTFAGNLLDQGEEYSFSWGGGGFGFVNNHEEPVSSNTICLIAVHIGSMAAFLDGIETVSMQTEPSFPDYTESSVTVAAVQVAASAVADAGDCTVVGTPQADTLRGTSGNDVMCGLGGDDVIYGFGGDDFILGGPGKNKLYGGPGSDSLYGGPQGDEIFGGPGTDFLLGGAGWDVLFAGDGNDFIYGEGDPDRAYGGEGRDWIELGPGDRQAAFGGDDDDILFGGPQRDRVYGGDGNDSLIGNAGADQLYGGPGDDQLNGGAGGDWLCGQAGSDAVDGGGDPGDRYCAWDRSDP